MEHGELAQLAACIGAVGVAALLLGRDRRAVLLGIGILGAAEVGLAVALVPRLPLADWLPRALAVTLVAMAAVFAAIGLWQLWSHHLFFAQDLEVANAYTTFFRVTSVFKDPSLYGRELVAAMAVLLVALWRGWIRPILALPVLALLAAGLYFSYSQTSFFTLFAVAAAVALVFGDRSTRIAIVAVVAAIAIGGGAIVAATSNGSHNRVTSGRSRLVHVTAVVFPHHPLRCVRLGAQAEASPAD